MADATFVDDQVRHTAFALLVRDGRPVGLQQLGASLPENVEGQAWRLGAGAWASYAHEAARLGVA